MSLEITAPANLLDPSPETAYFWGRVVGDGAIADNRIRIRTSDETAAHRLAAIAEPEQTRDGSDETEQKQDGITHHVREREYLHDTSITRRENEYMVTVTGDITADAASKLGLPTPMGAFEKVESDEPSNATSNAETDITTTSHPDYDFADLTEYTQPLLRGLFEGCGTICYKQSAGAVGLSFVHDKRILERINDLLGNLSVPTPTSDPAPASGSGHWFSLDDDAAPAVGRQLYADTDSTGLFAPSRRRKLLGCLDRIDNE
ncbi:cobalamin biosynthesis protein [Haloquadratum walsbyi]|jgi:hypothetical protein|uniref:cobalamin biosynthesis protein n=1 Tax=Haloquadratum walsbyi TaxID=293091 RepID=UPI0015F5C89C|nr:cobalamin biosynthesis protein [Haloquadratum walsbyi]